MGLPLIPSYIICIIGNMLPVPFIYFFARKVLVWGSDKPVIGKFSPSAWKKGEKVAKNSGKSRQRPLRCPAPFRGIPSGTGAWTGTLAASLLDMDFKSSVVAVMCGVFLAGVIMALISNGVLGALSFML